MRAAPLAARVLVVDDDSELADRIVEQLEATGLRARAAYSSDGAITLLEEGELELVMGDEELPGLCGLDLVRVVQQRWPHTKVALLSRCGSIDSAVEAIQTGACDYLMKPFSDPALLRVVRRALALPSPGAELDVSAVVGDVAAAVCSDDLLEGLKRALRVLLQATGADDGEIFLCEPDGRDPLLCAWTGPDDDALSDRTRFAAGVGYPGIVVATGKPICRQGNLADDPRYLRKNVVQAGIRSMVAVPLPGNRGALGSLHVMSRSEEFPVERVLELLQRAAVPLGSGIRAGLAGLRQTVDAVCGDLDDGSRQLRVVLEAMMQLAGAQYGTLALIDPVTNLPSQVASTGPASLMCAHAEGGALLSCPSVLAAHGFAAQPGRREWPESCRCGLPRRAASPCCLPLVSNGNVYGLVVLDFGREGPQHAHTRLVPLLCMASQLAIRLQSRHAGSPIQCVREARELVTIAPPSAPELALRCFGPFTVLRRGQPIPAESFTRGKALVLLKLLALHAGAPVNRDVLIEHLWPEVEPRQGANRLHGVVHDLRCVIEPSRTERDWLYVRSRGEFYYLDVSSPIDIDLLRFRELLARGTRADDERSPGAAPLLEQAVDAYRGELFADEPFAEWCDAERGALKEGFVDALERLARHYQEQGNSERALACWRRALRSSPFREDLLMLQMELLRELGRPREALAACEEHERSLKNELDAEPSAELLALHRRVEGTLQAGARIAPVTDLPKKRAGLATRALR